MAWINRSQITNAPYNPRKISDEAKRRLKANLEKVGLTATLTWNKRTGNLVSGHQRLSVLDSLEGRSDYQIQVTIVDLDDKTEREQNIFMNNAMAQGDWDMGKLELLFIQDGIGADGAGFVDADIHKLFGDSPEEDSPKDAGEVVEALQAIEERQANPAAIGGGPKRDDSQFYLVVVFGNKDVRSMACSALGIQDHRFIDGRIVLAKLGIALPAETPTEAK